MLGVTGVLSKMLNISIFLTNPGASFTLAAPFPPRLA